MTYLLPRPARLPRRGAAVERPILERAWVKAALFWGTLVGTWVAWSGVAHAMGV